MALIGKGPSLLTSNLPRLLAQKHGLSLRSTASTSFHTIQTRSVSSAPARALSRPLPEGTWDSHMHVVGNVDKYPLAANAQYKPTPHTLSDGSAFYSSLGIKNLVFVQPSIYGNDNSCMLDALREVTPQHGRAVVTFDPNTISTEQLREWHEIGVRGVRVNLVSVGREVTERELRKELEAYATVIAPLNWVLQLYIPLKLTRILQHIVPELGVKVCIDHFGSPPLPNTYDPSSAIDPYKLEGFRGLINLLQGEDTWVKLSAPYRLSKDSEGKMRDLDAIARELLKHGPNRCVYATDWPHTRFENVDSVPFIERCFEWCGEGTGLAEKLFRDNAEELWDVSKSST